MSGLLFIFFFSHCSGVRSPEPFAFTYPDYFPTPVPSPTRNPLTQAGVALGKQLFFDASLSRDGRVSCATCHQPERAFSDSVAFSSGVSGHGLQRHTPPLINLAWGRHFFWDGGVENLESLSFAALSHPDEMGAELSTMVSQLSQSAIYPPLFKKAFGTDSIVSAWVSRALAQYLRSLTNHDAKYDHVMQGKAAFSHAEQAGWQVFQQHCAACHAPPLFTDHVFHHNGIRSVFQSDPLNLYAGRFRITLDSADFEAYKTPTLRNITLTAPYMHDGRFAQLKDVLLHYQNAHRTKKKMDSLIQLIRLDMTDLRHLNAFLHTLTDRPE